MSPTRGRAALPCRRARSPAPRSASPFGEGLLAAGSSRASCHGSVWRIYRISSNFTEFGKGFLNPSLYLALRGQGTTMSGVSFNRKRAKLKQLLGIRARLALLAVILVAPLMLERVRSLEDTRARQIAAASDEFANLAKHSADTQREVISSVETMLKSAAYIRASAAASARSCDVLRASLPTNLPWIRSSDRRPGRAGAVLDQQHVCRPRSQRPRLFQEGAGDPRLRLQRLICSAKSNNSRS